MATNMALINKRQLVSLDTKIYEQAKLQLAGRSLFPTFNVPRMTQAYAYDVIKVTGKARRAAQSGRNTDTPVGDETKTRAFSPMTEWEYAIEYSDREVEMAQAANDNQFTTRKASQAGRAMAEYEDKVIFNGIPEDNIVGVTEKPDKTGFQELKPAKTLDQMDSKQLLAYFKEASHLITDLGYSNQKPNLLITTDVESILDNFYNEYRETTVEDYISKYFSQIRVVKELEGKFTGRKQDMALIYLNDPDTVGIPTAIPMEREWQEHFEGRTKIKYHEKFGGVVVRYPRHFVQLPGLTKA